MMSKATARANANLAFVKYWGKRDASLNIPLNNSISMNLSAAQTLTTVEFDSSLNQDRVLLGNIPAPDKFATKVSHHLDRIREVAGVQTRAAVMTENNFPASTGFASSASGFAALTRAAAAALDLELSERQLSILARQGSGSACRSIPGGFVEWQAGANNENSFAEQLAPASHWDLADVAVLVTREGKQVSSTDGHQLALWSPFWEARSAVLPNRLDRVRRAILERDFDLFGREIEAEAMSMHAIMLTSAHETQTAWHSGIYYWVPATLQLLIAVQQWRDEGLPVYFTLDAGPTVHLICPAEAEAGVVASVKAIASPEWSMIVSHPGPGAELVEE